jgi:muconate cycloisomerase
MKIVAVESIPVAVPIGSNVIIRSSLGVHDWSRFLLVKVMTDEGIIGLGEATVDPGWSGESQAMAKAAIGDILSPAVIGEDPTAIERLTLRMDHVLKGNPFSKAAVEMALYDISGKAAGIPVYRLLGGKVWDHVHLKCSVSAAEPRRAVEMARHFVSCGIRTLKIKVGIDPPGDIQRVAAVRGEVGDAVVLGVDANGGWTLPHAIATLRRMQEYGIAFAEQPVPVGNVLWMAEVKRSTGLPIVADESVFTLSDAMYIIRHDAADVINVYPGKNGGIGVAKKIAAVAEAAGCSCLVGSNLELGVASAAMAHFACSSTSMESEKYAADIMGPLYHPEDITAAPLDIRDGCLRPPEPPGLGVELDNEKVEYFRAH